MLRKIPGYRRGLRYAMGPPTHIAKGTPPHSLAIHELDNLDVIAGPEMQASNSTAWS